MSEEEEGDEGRRWGEVRGEEREKRRSGKRGEGKRVGTCVRLSANTNIYNPPILPLLP